MNQQEIIRILLEIKSASIRINGASTECHDRIASDFRDRTPGFIDDCLLSMAEDSLYICTQIDRLTQPLSSPLS